MCSITFFKKVIISKVVKVSPESLKLIIKDEWSSEGSSKSYKICVVDELNQRTDLLPYSQMISLNGSRNKVIFNELQKTVMKSNSNIEDQVEKL